MHYRNSKKFKCIDKYKVVSFDIFDTLITRNLNKPTDVFELIQKKLNETNFKISDFKEKRIQAEMTVRNKNEKKEITLDDIYNELSFEYSLEQTKFLKELEIECELDICEKNYSFYELYNYCKKNNKIIIIISDMYLNKKYIEDILQKNEIEYDKIYISSELSLTKRDGDIYKFVLEDLKINKNEIIHFGDNFKSDYLKAKMMGVKSKIVKYNKQIWINSNETSKLEYACMQNFINNHLNKIEYINKSYFWKLGYQIFGPLLYAYAKWLEKNFKSNCFDKICFLSRDGYIMEKAFNIINKEFDTMYLYASRRALIVPTIWMNIELENVISSMFFNNSISLKAFFKKLGLDIENYEKLLEKYDYKSQQLINIFEIKNDEKFKKFYEDIKNEIYENSKEEYENLIEYFKNNGIKNNVAIVDIGWFGNMQKAIQKINEYSNMKLCVNGFYIGIVPESKIQCEQLMHGFLFEKEKNEDLFYKKKFFNALFEMVFMAPHGSVKKYGSQNIEFYKYEYQNSEIEKNIKEFQNGALQFVMEFNEYNKSMWIDIDERTSLLNFIQLGNNPSNNDIKMFEQFNFLDDDEYMLI